MGIPIDTLYIVLKKKYFEQIISGEKTEEYRPVTKFWEKKLNKQYSKIIFQMGMNKNPPRMEFHYLGYEKRIIKHEHFGENEVEVFVIKFEPKK